LQTALENFTHGTSIIAHPLYKFLHCATIVAFPHNKTEQEVQ